MNNLASMYEEGILDHEIYTRCYNKFKDLKNDMSKYQEPKKMLTKIYTDIYKDKCIVCYEKFIDNYYDILILSCGHMYHQKCFKGKLCYFKC